MGNVAMMDADKVPTEKYGDIEAYLIEVRSIGGISGAPAFVVETTVRGAAQSYLMGVMHGHWDVPLSDGKRPTASDMRGGEAINMGIAVVIPATKILEVLDLPEFVETRKQSDDAFRSGK